MRKELNLLPVDRRRLLTRESLFDDASDAITNVNTLLLTVGLMGVAVIAILQFLVFITSETVGQELEERVGQYGTLRQQVARENILLEEMKTIATDRIVWSDVLVDIFESMSPGTSISAMRGQLNNRTLAIEGSTTSRGAVVVIRQRLSDLSWTKEVRAPHTNLIERINPAFTVELELVPDLSAEEGQP